MVFGGTILVKVGLVDAKGAHGPATHLTRQHTAHSLQAPAASSDCSRSSLLLLAQSLLR
jgi:hypothetical protein